MNKAQQAPNGLELYRRLLTYALPHWKIFLLAVAAMILFAATDTGFAALMKPMLDANFVEQDPETIKLVPLALIGLFLFRGISGFISRYAMSWIGRHVIQALRGDMFKRLLKLPCAYFEKNLAGRLLSRLTFDVEQVAEASTNAVTVLIRDTLTMLFLLTFMFWVSGWLTLMFLVMGPAIAGLMRYVSKRFRKTSRHIQDSMGELTQFVEQTVSNHQVVKTFDANAQQAQMFEVVNQRNRKLHLKMALINSLSTPLVQLIAACTLAFVVYLASQRAVLSHITVGEFVSFITAMLLLMQPMKRLTNINVALQRGIAAAQSVFSLLDEPVETDSGIRHLRRAQGSISFENVFFQYDEDKGLVLNDINLSIEAGETVALVGRSGSGKTTLAKLIMRFYEVSAGNIRLDGYDIREYCLADLRKQIAVVGQEVMLFNETLENNIAFGAEEQVSQESIEAAARSAHAMEFISALPGGLQTRIGDRGILLSGGQRQRIAIARAILKDTPVLILDEATSSLDSESERYVHEAISDLMKGRTSLVIAHRLSTVEKADRIYVLERGSIVESGTHGELLAVGGVYAELYRVQFC